MLRLKLNNGGEVNIPAYKILAFLSQKLGSTVVLDGGLSYDVNESPRTIRNAIMKLNGVPAEAEGLPAEE